MQIPPAQAALLLDIARASIRAALGTADVAAIADASDPVLAQPAGCFVSLHRIVDHALRGCVGRLDARDSLIEAVRQTAAGVIDDPRFADERVTLDELPRLEIEISVLSPLRPAARTEDFDLETDGIYLIFGDRSGCFLPQVARETGWLREQLLDRLCTEKLGLPAIVWKHPQAKLFKFSTCIVGSEPFEKSPG